MYVISVLKWFTFLMWYNLLIFLYSYYGKILPSQKVIQKSKLISVVLTNQHYVEYFALRILHYAYCTYMRLLFTDLLKLAGNTFMNTKAKFQFLFNFNI